MRTGSISVCAPAEGLQNLGLVAQYAREYWGKKYGKSKALSIRDFGEMVGLDRNKIHSLERAGTSKGFWQIHEDDLRHLAPFTINPDRDKPYTVTELIAIARGEIIPAIADTTQAALATHQNSAHSLDSLIHARPISDTVTTERHNSGSSNRMASHNYGNYGLKYLAALMQVCRVDQGLTIDQIVHRFNTETLVRTDAQTFRAVESGSLSALPPGFLPAIAGLGYLSDGIRPYSVSELMQVALGNLIPINKRTGQPFNSADLRLLGIEANDCQVAH